VSKKSIPRFTSSPSLSEISIQSSFCVPVLVHPYYIMNVIYGYIPSNTTIIVFQLVFISGYMFQAVYNGRLQALARGGVLHIV
jgi:hypothetical protein